MKVMVFDVGGTEIKYSVMDEQMNRFDAGSVPTPQDTQEHFLDTIYALYAPHKDEVDGIAMALPGFVDANTGYVSNGGALLYNTGTQVGQLVVSAIRRTFLSIIGIGRSPSYVPRRPDVTPALRSSVPSRWCRGSRRSRTGCSG